MSGMSVLSGLRASVETFPVWWAFPTLGYYARYDSPIAYGGLSLSQYSLPPACHVFYHSAWVPALFCVQVSPSVPQEPVDHTPSFATAGTSGAPKFFDVSLPACTA